MKSGRAPYGLTGANTIVLDGEAIAWVGAYADMPSDYRHGDGVDLGGRLVTPALIDCHTHLIFGGHRAMEFEMRLNGASYEEVACLPALRAAHAEGLVDAVDAFCEGIAFSPTQVAQVFAVAQALDLPIKIHAEQLSNFGGAKMAAGYGALSADHIEYLDEDGAAALAAAGTTAVILPGAFYTLRETQMPPIDLLRKYHVPMAVATDANPGSSPMTSILLAMNMASTLFRMTPQEALAGATRNAARALGLSDRGMIAPGLRADIAVWNAQHPAELAYRIGFNPLHTRIFGGEFWPR